jgi:hypothetical protein
MVTCIIFKNHFLEVGLTQNRETMALQTLTTVWFYHVWGPAWIDIHWNSIWLRARSHMTSHYSWGSVTTLHDFGGVLGQPLDTFLWALTLPWSWLLARVWSGPYSHQWNSCPFLQIINRIKCLLIIEACGELLTRRKLVGHCTWNL